MKIKTSKRSFEIRGPTIRGPTPPAKKNIAYEIVGRWGWGALSKGNEEVARRRDNA